MIVVTLERCPPALRGDLTKWLFEVNTGVYVGHVGARVRNALWQRICDQIKDGRATMVYSTNNEQRFDFRVHHSDWKIADFDGMKLMLHPAAPLSDAPTPAPGFSNAARQLKAKRTGKRPAARSPQDYVLIDTETTGLREREDHILELSAIRIIQGECQPGFHALLRQAKPIPETIVRLTGITDAMLAAEGREAEAALPEFLAYISDLPLVSHNIRFDMRFLYAACERLGLPPPGNRCIDTLALARKAVHDVTDYKLSTLARHFGINVDAAHRSTGDCLITKEVFEKVNEILERGN